MVVAPVGRIVGRLARPLFVTDVAIITSFSGQSPLPCRTRPVWLGSFWLVGAMLMGLLSGCGSPELAGRASNAMLPASPASLQMTPSVFNGDEQGRALRGYDAVAYFSEGRAQIGSSDWQWDWNGVTWLFSSAEHRDRFAQNPERYAPAYGGYCSFGVLFQQKLESDPSVWAIEGDRLHVFLNEGMRRQFEQHLSENLEKANQNWIALQHLPPEALE